MKPVRRKAGGGLAGRSAAGCLQAARCLGCQAARRPGGWAVRRPGGQGAGLSGGRAARRPGCETAGPSHRRATGQTYADLKPSFPCWSSRLANRARGRGVQFLEIADAALPSPLLPSPPLPSRRGGEPPHPRRWSTTGSGTRAALSGRFSVFVRAVCCFRCLFVRHSFLARSASFASDLATSSMKMLHLCLTLREGQIKPRATDKHVAQTTETIKGIGEMASLIVRKQRMHRSGDHLYGGLMTIISPTIISNNIEFQDNPFNFTPLASLFLKCQVLFSSFLN